MKVKNSLFLFLALLNAIHTILSEKDDEILSEEDSGIWCPEKYEMYTEDHTFCKECCGDCKIFKKGVSSYLKEQILDMHNGFRSRVAAGYVSLNHLPRAANMLQFFWDDELADLAQKWANQCSDNHDCALCRMVDRFEVGQQYFDSYEYEMDANDLRRDFWSLTSGLRSFWKEHVANYTIEPSHTGRNLYSLLLWAKTYRIGCGFVYFEKDGRKKSRVVCNYGPKGNVEGEEVYKSGEKCSACPSNTCCEESCEKYGITKGIYKGLCRLIEQDVIPGLSKPREKTGDEVFYCSFRGEPDCAYAVERINRWKIDKSTGPWLHTILKRREYSTLHFKTPIKTKSGKLCIIVETRSGPTFENERKVYKYSITAKLERKEYDIYLSTITFPPANENLKHFFHKDYIQPVKLPVDQEMKFSLRFSIPSDSEEHYFDIDRIIALEKDCPKVTTQQESKLRKAECEL